MNDIAVLTTEDAVVEVFTIDGKTFVSPLSEAVEITPAVPTYSAPATAPICPRAIVINPAKNNAQGLW